MSERRAFPACAHAKKKKKVVRGVAGIISNEPFRLFFPTALLVSAAGVSLWPFFYLGWVPFPPGLPHARLMVEGFLGGFAVGFLGTALPRMMSAPRLTIQEVAILYCLYLGVAVSHLTGRVVLGDWFFLGLLVVFAGCAAVRLLFGRKDVPPPGFVLVGMGFTGAMVGVVLLLAGNVVLLTSFQFQLANLLLYEGMMLAAVMGVGGFLLPRFFGRPSRENLPESISPPPGWRGPALTAFLCGLLLLGTFFLEAAGWMRWGRAVRFVVVGAYLANAVPFLKPSKGGGSLGFAVRVALVFLLAGVLGAAFYPQFRVGTDHLMYVAGFGLVTLAVSTRVILGHSGNVEVAMQGRVRPVQWIVWILVMAALTRAVAEFLPKIMVTHHIYAALLWIAAVLIWGLWLGRRLRQVDEED